MALQNRYHAILSRDVLGKKTGEITRLTLESGRRDSSDDIAACDGVMAVSRQPRFSS